MRDGGRKGGREGGSLNYKRGVLSFFFVFCFSIEINSMFFVTKEVLMDLMEGGRERQFYATHTHTHTYTHMHNTHTHTHTHTCTHTHTHTHTHTQHSTGRVSDPASQLPVQEQQQHRPAAADATARPTSASGAVPGRRQEAHSRAV